MKHLFIDAKNQKIYFADGEFADLQKFVGGYLEKGLRLTPPHAAKQTAVYADEEGRLKGYPYGFTVQGHMFTGNGVLMTYDADSGETEDTPEEFLSAVLKHTTFHDVPMPRPSASDFRIEVK